MTAEMIGVNHVNNATNHNMNVEILRQLYAQVLTKGGVEYQLDVAIEEMAELTHAIVKRRRGRNDWRDVAEECADVLVLMDQVLLICDQELGDGFVARVKAAKLERLRQRLADGRPRL